MGNSTSKPTAAQGNIGRFLTDLIVIESDGRVETGSVAVSGELLPRSVTLRAVCCGWSGTNNFAKAEYDLGRHYRRFGATVGLADDSISSAAYLIEVYGDSKRLAVHTVRLGNSVAVDVDVTGILRLRLATTWVEGDQGVSGKWSSRSVFGDAVVTGVQGEVPG
ncbi:hypothetical protein FDG2_0968 [Candidatus Protofrankia californiensis]|uniref:Glycosyl hydrolase family 98 putative carbohydrate-binding module domain-containing protein n=1 Tax=Candidatus Protofrankia californiensis TaxID=1839754 RepID=A0A1C3NUQ2_9ACTN|nr:hypothetical protein FDG2_0968 [Candidatus Protofrankia californiensis]